MKILLDARTATEKYPGIGRYASELINALADLFDTTGDTLVTIESSACRTRLGALAKVKSIPCDVPPDSPSSKAAITSIIKEIRPDIYHTPQRVGIPNSDVPVVLTIHDCAPLRCPYETTPQERIAYIASMNAAIKSCTRAIALSHTLRDDIEEFFPEAVGKSAVVMHGIGKAYKPTSSQDHEDAANTYSYKRPAIVYIGNNKRHKNLVELFRGFARAQNMLHGVRLVLGGYGCAPLARHVRLMDELGISEAVSWIGAIAEKDMPAVFGSATALAMPSLYEGFSMPIAEAMACGVPVACSDIKAFREIAHDTATYFNPEKPETIAQALVTAATDNIVRNRNRAAAIERAHGFSWASAANRTLEVYKEAVADFISQTAAGRK